jgi:fructokinase
MADFPLFVAAGEALTDMIVQDPAQQQWFSQVGGSTWNVARTMARLDVPTAFAGAISRDVFGDALWQASEAAKLDLRFLQRYHHSPLLAIVHRTDPPAYFFVGDNSADLQFDAAQLPQGWSAHCRWVHFGGISLARQPLASKLVALAEQLKLQGVRISYDPNYRLLMNRDYDSTLRRMTELADVVKVSEEDLAGLFRTDDIDTAFATLRSWNPGATYLYTKGGDGASGPTSWRALPKPAIPARTAPSPAASSCTAWATSQERAFGDHPYRRRPGSSGQSRHAVPEGRERCSTSSIPRRAPRCPQYRGPGENASAKSAGTRRSTASPRLMKDDRDKNFIATNQDGKTVNRWLTTGFLAASATTNETAFLTYKVVRSTGMLAFDNQARV